eukprot:gene40980-50704_t
MYAAGLCVARQNINKKTARVAVQQDDAAGNEEGEGDVDEETTHSKINSNNQDGGVTVLHEEGLQQLAPHSSPSSGPEENTLKLDQTLHPTTTVASAVTGTADESTTTPPPVKLQFSRLVFIIKLMTFLSIFMTFGVLFPPLGVMLIVSLYKHVYDTQLDLAEYVAYHLQINNTAKCEAVVKRRSEHVVEALNNLMWQLFPIASTFYAFFLFDMVGDRYGWRYALVSPCVMVALPLAARYAYQYHRFRETRSLLNTVQDASNIRSTVNSKHKGGNSVNKMTSLEGSSNQNAAEKLREMTSQEEREEAMLGEDAKDTAMDFITQALGMFAR